MTDETLPVTTTDSYPVRIGVAVDETVNVVVFNGQPDETISQHAAVAQRDGKRWGCILCGILNIIIEPHHCANQFEPGTTTPLVAFRSALAMSLLVLPLFGLYRIVVSLASLF